MSYKYGGLKLSHGNHKLGKDTLIFNMGSYTYCSSRKLGLCTIEDKCYAKKAELNYKAVLPYRTHQEMFWLSNSAVGFLNRFEGIMAKHKRALKNVRYFRINEAGDFHNQNCIWKLDVIATELLKRFNIITYTYTARSDLDFSNVSFLVKGSDNNVGNNGRTITRSKNILHNKLIYLENGQSYFVCGGNCRTCSVCKIKNGTNVVFPIH